MTTPAEYLDLGWHLLPIALGTKRPHRGQGLEHATTDYQQVLMWGGEGCDWAAACEPSGFIVLDVDPRNGGDETWAALLEGHSDLPPHSVQGTRNGGEHHLFADPGVELLGKLGDGVDLKRRGYILVVPTPGYSWQVAPWDISAPAMPDDWLELARKDKTRPQRRPQPKPRPQIGSHSRYGAKALDAELYAVRGECEGGRNIRLNQAAVALGSLAAGGELDEPDARAELRQAGLDAGLPEREVDATIRSGWTHGASEPRTAPALALCAPAWEETPPPIDEDAPMDSDVIDIDAGADQRPPEQRPVIRVSPEIEQVVDKAEAAILALQRRNLYQRGGALVRVSRGVEPAAKGQDRPPGACSIHVAPPAYLTEMCSKAATWWRFDERAKKSDDPWKRCLPPAWVTPTLAGRAQWTIPPLLGIITAPTLRPDGTVLARPGYDAATGLLFLPGGVTFPEIPAQPTLDDAQSALLRLVEPFRDFPFSEECDRAAAVSAVLSVVCRAAIKGSVPLYTVRATVAGTGKTLLADVVAVIGTGLPAPKYVQSQTAEEERKRLLAVAMEGDPVLCIDNVDRTLGTGPLDSAITAGVVKDRLLGQSINAEAPWRAVVMATGNNLQVRGDTGRRVVPIDLDAGVEQPELRSGWRHPDLIPWVSRHRAEMVSAALTICRAHAVAGWPLCETTPLGSFEAWSCVARASLVWCGMADPAAGRDRIHRDADPELDGLRDLMRAWHDHYGEDAITLADMAEEISETNSGTGRALRGAVEGAIAGRRKGTTATKLGYYLRRYRGRVVGGMKLASLPKEGVGVPWAVELIGPKTTSSDHEKA